MLLLILTAFGLFAIFVLLILLVLSRALRTLHAGAERFARGDLSQRVTVSGPLQVAAVAEALNKMATQLDDRLQTVVQQRNELEAVLAGMAEGVLAFDMDEKLLKINRAAANLLQTSVEDALGRNIQEVVRNPGLQSFVTQVLTREAPVESELALSHPSSTRRRGFEQLHLQAQGTALRDASGRRIGGLIVLHDVTQMHRLESIRRDFVANVSHEIKTPISTIKAAAETVTEMLAGEPDVQAGDAARNFVRIITRQADRLHAIVEDLLTLARLEQEGGANRLERGATQLAGVLHGALETCQPKADAKRMTVDIHCDPALAPMVNAALLEQAVVNLLDNAIKYSPDGGRVEIRGRQDTGELLIEVQDYGTGIEPEHLPRLFERFYRSDKARSRAVGGTGLGLAIVKHVAQVHGGRASVVSKLGEGSTFRLHLPTRDDAPASV